MKTEINELHVNMIGGSWRPEWDKTSYAMAPMWRHIEKCRSAVRETYAKAAELSANPAVTPRQRWAALRRHIDDLLPSLDPTPWTGNARVRIGELRRTLTPADPKDHKAVIALRQANRAAVRELDDLEKALEVMTWTRNGARRLLEECLGLEPTERAAAAGFRMGV